MNRMSKITVKGEVVFASIICRLRNQLAADAAQNEAELFAKEETTEERIGRMKLRVHHLQEKRETERKVVMEEKLLQKWRNNCDELRLSKSIALEKETARARDKQLAEHQVAKVKLHQSLFLSMLLTVKKVTNIMLDCGRRIDSARTKLPNTKPFYARKRIWKRCIY